jgi:hypothetical protein
MKFKAIGASALILAAGLVFASEMRVWTSQGEGVAANATTKAHVRVSATKRLHASVTEVVGNVQVDHSTLEHPGTKFKLTVREYASEGNRSQMSGPAVLYVPGANGYEEVRGTGRAFVLSRRHPLESGDPDRIGVAFIREGVTRYAFEGNLVEGDLTVIHSVTY